MAGGVPVLGVGGRFVGFVRGLDVLADMAENSLVMAMLAEEDEDEGGE